MHWGTLGTGHSEGLLTSRSVRVNAEGGPSCGSTGSTGVFQETRQS